MPVAVCATAAMFLLHKEGVKAGFTSTSHLCTDTQGLSYTRSRELIGAVLLTACFSFCCCCCCCCCNQSPAVPSPPHPAQSPCEQHCSRPCSHNGHQHRCISPAQRMLPRVCYTVTAFLLLCCWQSAPAAADLSSSLLHHRTQAPPAAYPCLAAAS
jgi:hypothetical protein